jgi:hypothetical protein
MMRAPSDALPNGVGVDRNATFSSLREQKRFLAKHKYGVK